MLSSSEAANIAKARITADEAREFLAHATQLFRSKPFNAHRVFSGGHAQTLAGYAWPRRFRLRPHADQERLFQVAPDTQVLANCRWQTNPTEHPTIVIWHGMEGSSAAVYMLATAQKAFRAGFNVVRMNLRNCGATEHLTPTLYHGGLSEDPRAVVTELIERDGLSKIFLAGFSLGGNLVLKLAGEYGEGPPKEILGVCAVSPSVDLDASANLINQPSNRIYQRDFLRRLRKRIYIKKKLYPKLYDTAGIRTIQTIRQFDDRFTAVAHGFANAADYYDRASALRVIDLIRVPTLIIHAHDDPFIPFEPLRHPSIAANPYILLLDPERGGHVAFLASRPSRVNRDPVTRDARETQEFEPELSGNDSRFPNHYSATEDRFWAENRMVEFFTLADETW
ncbi:MAG: YheT family hydrolase [Pyrinomonadaceae bacterium]